MPSSRCGVGPHNELTSAMWWHIGPIGRTGGWDMMPGWVSDFQVEVPGYDTDKIWGGQDGLKADLRIWSRVLAWQGFSLGAFGPRSIWQGEIELNKVYLAWRGLRHLAVLRYSRFLCLVNSEGVCCSLSPVFPLFQCQFDWLLMSQFCSAGEIFLETKAPGCNLGLSLKGWDSTAPDLNSEESTSTMMGLHESGCCSTGAMVKAVFNLWNASSTTKVRESFWAPFFRRAVRDMAVEPKLLLKWLYKLAKPRKCCKSFMVLGVGHSITSITWVHDNAFLINN